VWKFNWQGAAAGIPSCNFVHALQTERRTALTLRRKLPIWRSVLLVAALVWSIDLGSKSWALHNLAGREPQRILGNFLRLTLTRNSGAAFSFATGGAILLASFAILVVFSIGYWAPRLTSRPWGYVFGLVLGGTLGNLSDRIFRASGNQGAFRGQVIDWISLPLWPVFNLADSAIVIAAVIAAYLSIRNIPPVTKRNKDGHDESEGSNGS